MRKWVVPILAALAVAVVGPTLAGDAKVRRTHKCSFDVTGLFARVKVISGMPPANGSDKDAATLDGKFCGKRFRGAARSVNKYPTLGTVTSKGRSFGPSGSVKYKLSGTGTLNSDGSISFSGSGKVRGGTARYKLAKGSFSFSGTQPAGSTVASLRIKGKIKY